MDTRQVIARVATMVAIVALAGCSASDALTGSAGRAVSLSFTSKGSAGAARVGPSAVNAVTVSAGANTLVITKAQVVFAKIELASSLAAACEDSADDSASSSSGAGCEDMELGPQLIDLPTDASVVTQINASVPAGTYDALEAKVHVAQSGEAGGAAFLAAHPEFAGTSVLVEGTFNGTPFTYTGSAEGNLELQFSPPVVVGTSGLNITVNVDLSTWFSDGAGGVIDPSTANAGGVNESLVANNIQQSFHAFEDDNHDGVSDH